MVVPQEGTVSPSPLLETQLQNLASLCPANRCVLFSDLRFAKEQAARRSDRL